MAHRHIFAVNSVASTVASAAAAAAAHPTVVVVLTIIMAFGFYRLKVFLKRDHVFYYHPNQSRQQAYCAVCLHDAVEGERLRRLPDCKHCFHADCLDPWLQAHSTCPLCRSHVSPAHHHRPTLLSQLVLLLKLIATKTGNPLCLEIPLALCDSLGYIP